jgi:hypothetical protein
MSSVEIWTGFFALRSFPYVVGRLLRKDRTSQLVSPQRPLLTDEVTFLTCPGREPGTNFYLSTAGWTVEVYFTTAGTTTMLTPRFEPVLSDRPQLRRGFIHSTSVSSFNRSYCKSCLMTHRIFPLETLHSTPKYVRRGFPRIIIIWKDISSLRENSLLTCLIRTT